MSNGFFFFENIYVPQRGSVHMCKLQVDILQVQNQELIAGFSWKYSCRLFSLLRSYLTEKQIKKRVVRWDLKGLIHSGYVAHCSRPFFKSIRIEFLAFYSMLSQSLVTLTSLEKLFINLEFCQCPLRRSCQLLLF